MIESIIQKDLATLAKLYQQEPNADDRATSISQAYVPVLNTFLIKDLRADETNGLPYILGTFVQQTFGLQGEQADTPFDYRFNDTSAESGSVVLRKTVHHTISEEHQNIRMSVFTFNVKVPLELVTDYDRFPCTAIRATADMEPTTHNDITHKQVILRPNLLLSKQDRRDNVCLQQVKGCSTDTQQNTTVNCTSFRTKKGSIAVLDRLQDKELELMKKVDKLGKYQLISPYPQVAYTVEKSSRCKRLQVSFYLVEEGVSKFFRIVLPMLLVGLP